MIEILTFAFIIRTLHVILYHLFWWERKEYRFDRMFVHLRETVQGKYWLANRLTIIKWLILAIGLIAQFIFPPLFLITQLFVLIYLVEALKAVRDLRSGWKKPAVRPRAVGIFLTTLILISIAVLYLWPKTDFSLNFLLIDKMIGPLIAVLVFLGSRVFQILKLRKIRLAGVKIAKAKHLKVIGISGSYGKTTTKEFLAQILASKYHVLKTQASQNTDIGIAEVILRSNLSEFDYFVCEMSAYHQGEIKSICSMLKGRIAGAVITGINEQHQSLFKSLENTMAAKFEVVNEVLPRGFALFNAENKYCREMFQQARKRKLLPKLVDLSVLKQQNLRVKLPGSFFKQNLALAVAASQICGLTNTQVANGIKDLKLPTKTMNVIKQGSMIIIDDSFNANPDGVYEAINYLQKFKQRKILVLQPLIELGKYAYSIHEKIGQMAVTVCDAVVLANPNFKEEIFKGASKVPYGRKKILFSLPSWALKNSVLLFEGKESEKFMKTLKH